MVLLLFSAVAVAGATALFVTRSLAREMWNRVLAERDLREAHDYLEKRVDQRTADLAAANTALKATHATLQLEMAERKQLEGQLLQSEKLASVGQLAAGVAHEINNPVGFITSNCSTLAGYQDKLFELIRAYQLAEAHVADTSMREQLAALRKGIDLEFLQEDIPVLLRESAQGLERVRLIVQNLRDFSRVDSSSDWQYANLASAADATLELAANAIAAKADVVREYGVVEDIECLPAQINQVLMNLLQNAAQAIGSQRGCITVRTGHEGKNAWFEVGDNGEGIEAKNLNRVFEPFFTTRPVGQGTGLGLSLAYGIVRKHLGSIDVRSEPGNGTTVRVTLPLRQSPVSA